MPFKKVGKNKYKSPSGRTYTGKQVRMYHANDGFPDSVKKVAKAMSKKKKQKAAHGY